MCHLCVTLCCSIQWSSVFKSKHLKNFALSLIITPLRIILGYRRSLLQTSLGFIFCEQFVQMSPISYLVTQNFVIQTTGGDVFSDRNIHNWENGGGGRVPIYWTRADPDLNGNEARPNGCLLGEHCLICNWKPYGKMCPKTGQKRNVSLEDRWMRSSCDNIQQPEITFMTLWLTLSDLDLKQ